MEYTVLTTYVDMANKHRVTVQIDDASVMFKFDEAPTDEQLQLVVDEYIANKPVVEVLTEAELIQKQIDELTAKLQDIS